MSSRKALFYALLGAATLGLSEFLAAWRAWRAAGGLGHVAQVVLLGLGLLGTGLWLGFLLYEVDRAAGRVRRPIGLYEWIIGRRGRVDPEARRPVVLPGRGVSLHHSGRGRG
ncbi:MAG: hypothetical protein E6H04_02765 [Bacillati bacterium ANGP1]|uniref:Uncharacterized protein n=1 Tax=Candidatus Segetimicrobium genomatis TaxID=2569760 RepID=A0A537JIZ5_9BACT|nr:MAG: hypothetical protein E6H04_02765 [Terrabacteria group bacterium ANGP1]